MKTLPSLRPNFEENARIRMMMTHYSMHTLEYRLEHDVFALVSQQYDPKHKLVYLGFHLPTMILLRNSKRLQILKIEIFSSFFFAKIRSKRWISTFFGLNNHFYNNLNIKQLWTVLRSFS